MLKKSINIWSFSPEKSLEDCFRLAKAAGFEGIEPALSKNGPISLSSTKSELQQIRALADRIGIKIHSLATGLYWQYSLTSNIPENREKAKEIVKKLTEKYV